MSQNTTDSNTRLPKGTRVKQSANYTDHFKDTRPYFTGTIVGYSRCGTCNRVHRDGKKTTDTYHKSFVERLDEG